MPQSHTIATDRRLCCNDMGFITRVSDHVLAFEQVHGSTSYTDQDPWIQNCSLQDNVLMGLPLDSALYDSVLRACALLPDLDLLPAGDQTEIGKMSLHTHLSNCITDSLPVTLNLSLKHQGAAWDDAEDVL